ncbi:MAG: GNAT family N-acetyltransferase [Planctomycetota bacterium]|nr:MAG: GNAT family N-acetyltransferase [Planctomycetota bacterium]
MHVVAYRNMNKAAVLAGFWDQLARGIPFRSWTWCRHWWNAYGDLPGRELFVVVVFDSGGWPIAIAPWYRERDPLWGNVIRFLGTGEVCSDHLGLLCEPGMEITAAEVLAAWLVGAHDPSANDRKDRPVYPRKAMLRFAAFGDEEDGTDDGRVLDKPLPWDMLELTGVVQDNVQVTLFVDALREHECRVSQEPGPNLWRIPLEKNFESYLQRLSKNQRRNVRRRMRDHIDSGHAVLQSVSSLEMLRRGCDILIDLHQRRRQSLGEPGCFASERFRRFHLEMMPDLLRKGMLGLHWVEYDGVPVAVDYQLQGAGIVYAYQAGIDPDRLDVSPGHLANLLTIRRAIEHGARVFDFLRGDERYKADLGAVPCPTVEYRIVPPRLRPRVNLELWQLGKRGKRLAKATLRRWLPVAEQ